jgi:hypothetical protein
MKFPFEVTEMILEQVYWDHFKIFLNQTHYETDSTTLVGLSRLLKSHWPILGEEGVNTEDVVNKFKIAYECDPFGLVYSFEIYKHYTRLLHTAPIKIPADQELEEYELQEYDYPIVVFKYEAPEHLIDLYENYMDLIFEAYKMFFIYPFICG